MLICGFKTIGGKITVDDVDRVGIVLWFINSSVRKYGFRTIFGLVPTSVNVWINVWMKFMFRLFKINHRNDFEVSWKFLSELRIFTENLVRNRTLENHLSGIFALDYGLKIPCSDHDHVNIRN